MTYKGEQEVLGYDSEMFRKGAGLVRQARIDLDAVLNNLTPQNADRVLKAAAEAVIGTLMASEAIHHPAVTHPECNDIVNRTKTLGSASDFVTDLRGLEGLVKFMDPGLLVLSPRDAISFSDH